VSARTVELLDGAVTITVVRPPRLEARMSTSDGGEVVYLPARLEVSGDGIEAAKLDTAGDRVEFTVGKRWRSGPGRWKVDGPLPTVPGLPWPRTPDGESGPSGFAGTHVRISLGDVRQAAQGHAIAARVEAVTVVITGAEPAGPVLDLDIGVLESAARSPEVDGGAAGQDGAARTELAVTGARADLVALSGLGLLAGGVAAMAFGVGHRCRTRLRRGSHSPASAVAAGRLEPSRPRD
jgi:hypothetical protein